MRFEKVALATVGFQIPPVVVTSASIEERLAPIYERLRLPTGRLEGMSGIVERRLWEPGTRLSDISILTARKTIEASGIPPTEIRCLIHASVCREFLEPATACRVHWGAGLPNDTWVYDVSNACLGLMNGIVQIGTMIETGAIRAGLVVGTEDASGLLQATIDQLLNDPNLTRQSIKPAFASLTIGSGSCALLLVDRDYFGIGGRVFCATARANTNFHHLCQSEQDRAGSGMLPTMQTDSEQLLEAGVATGVETLEAFLKECPWEQSEVDVTVCHQVGSSHRKRMLEAFHFPEDRDFAVFQHLGNTGSVALPTALGIGLQLGKIEQPARAALLGIGSGINCVMIAAALDGIAVSSNVEQWNDALKSTRFDTNPSSIETSQPGISS